MNLSTAEGRQFIGVKVQAKTGSATGFQNAMRLVHVENAFLAKDVDTVHVQLTSGLESL